jgi:hypothetical protein
MAGNDREDKVSVHKAQGLVMPGNAELDGSALPAGMSTLRAPL